MLALVGIGAVVTYVEPCKNTGRWLILAVASTLALMTCTDRCKHIAPLSMHAICKHTSRWPILAVASIQAVVTHTGRCKRTGRWKHAGRYDLRWAGVTYVGRCKHNTGHEEYAGRQCV